MVATGTFMRINQRAEVLVSAVAHARIADPEYAFTALAFETKLLHQPPKLSIQRLESVFGLNPAVTAGLIGCFAVIYFLVLQAKYFLALAAHHGING